ncbi:MAG: amino acid ABC transporter permease [Propionibacteriaceae bacterium]|jgi:polar amino acid transport system permease protein|nr:amino acid ABC transporter permease [Propionibacteriaceae bacterium]
MADRVAFAPLSFDRAVAQETEFGITKPLHVGRWTSATIVTLLLVRLLYKISINPAFEWGVFAKYFFWPTIMAGLKFTLWLAALTMVISLVFGFGLALVRLSENPVFQALAWGYVWIFRSIPWMVQLLFWYNIGYFVRPFDLDLPFLGLIHISPVDLISKEAAAMLGFALPIIATASEIIRGGIISVPKEQTQAGKVLGLSDFRISTRIVLPQALQAIVPSLGNLLIELIKGTSIVSVLAVSDLLYATQLISSSNYRIAPLLMVATVWYIIITSILSLAQIPLERLIGSRTKARRGVRSADGGTVAKQRISRSVFSRQSKPRVEEVFA